VANPKKQQPPRLVLFLDDEPDFLRVAQETFAPLSAGHWKIHCASTADAAQKQLRQREMDLLVINVNMPLPGGIEFLNVLSERYPDLKKVTITASATEDIRSECFTCGADLFIEKPQSEEGFKSVFAMLDDLMNWGQQQIGLQLFIQMECLGRNSSVIEVFNEYVLGRIYIENGNIIHAAVGKLTGDRALQRLLALPGGSFELAPFEPPQQATVSGQWEFLLTKASRGRDERASQTGPAKPAEEPKTLDAQTVPDELEPEQKTPAAPTIPAPPEVKPKAPVAQEVPAEPESEPLAARAIPSESKPEPKAPAEPTIPPAPEPSVAQAVPTKPEAKPKPFVAPPVYAAPKVEPKAPAARTIPFKPEVEPKPEPKTPATQTVPAKSKVEPKTPVMPPVPVEPRPEPKTFAAPPFHAEQKVEPKAPAGRTIPFKPEPETPAEPAAVSVSVMETLICSGAGKPLYDVDCTNVPGRVALLKKFSQQAGRFTQILPLGNFDRLELQLPDGRAIAQAKPDRMVFVRVANNPANQ
jgi:CheY-like chemotaxis protein